jgi:peroxiredoxin
MTIAVGDALPDVTFMIKGPDGLEKLSTADVFAGKTVALIGVPGAFTPTCHARHLPGYVGSFDAFMDKGVDTIACVSVNDAHVMKAWAEATDPAGHILFLADGNADFARATGLDTDISAGGMGTRLQRFSMLVRDGRVEELNLEATRGVVMETSAEKLLLAL